MPIKRCTGAFLPQHRWPRPPRASPWWLTAAHGVGTFLTAAPDPPLSCVKHGRRVPLVEAPSDWARSPALQVGDPRDPSVPALSVAPLSPQHVPTMYPAPSGEEGRQRSPAGPQGTLDLRLFISPGGESRRTLPRRGGSRCLFSGGLTEEGTSEESRGGGHKCICMEEMVPGTWR